MNTRRLVFPMVTCILLFECVYGAPSTAAVETTVPTTEIAPTTVPTTTEVATISPVACNNIIHTLPVIHDSYLGDIPDVSEDDELSIMNINPKDEYNPAIINGNGLYKSLKDCKALYDAGYDLSGLYVIHPEGYPQEFVVYCDMKLKGGGWTIIQRRSNGGHLSFDRDFNDYKAGFGDFTGEFWLGLDKIHSLTQPNVELHIGLYQYYSAFAQYGQFSVGNEMSGYQLDVSNYKSDSTVGDSLSFHNGKKFTTTDKDQDDNADNCATKYKGGWWYTSCFQANLNGGGSGNCNYNGIIWQSWIGECSISQSIIAIR